jgi:virulence-associated protein VapD
MTAFTYPEFASLRSPATIRERVPTPKIGIPPSAPRSDQRMYAVAFDMDTDTLAKSYPNQSWNNAYGDIRRVLERHGFTWQQGSVYFGGEQVNAVTCVLAVMDCTRSLAWFAASVRDIRMLRIEEFNDLMPAVQQAAGEGA